MRLVFDIEANGLLNSTTVDYNSSPYRLKDHFKVHCAVFFDIDTKLMYRFVYDANNEQQKTPAKAIVQGCLEVITKVLHSLQDFYYSVKNFILGNATELIGHNIINYDLLVLKAAAGLDYKIGVYDGTKTKYYSRNKDSIGDVATGTYKPITITDTLVLSKTLNPDRLMHSLEYFGKMHGSEKIDWRAKAIELGIIDKNAPKGAEFEIYHPEMLVYNAQDVMSNYKTWQFLLKEWGDWPWDEPYQLEKAVAEIITRQEHRGFYFDTDLAIECVKDLDEKMAVLKAIVEPLIPPKPIGKTAAKDYIPSKVQFKKNGELSSNIEKWVEKHGGSITKTEEGDYYAKLFDKEYKLPIPQEPIVTHVPATIRDTTHIKGWLVSIGWNPTAYKERDLTVDSRKKKLEFDKYVETCERYIAQTIASPFKKDRLEYLEVVDEKSLRKKLLGHDHTKRPMKVYTNPTLTVGMEKEIDPALLEMSDKFAHAKDVSDYLTYSHRRNSILGGGFDPEDLDDEDEEASKGWLSNDRIAEDHRIPTPADTCGAATTRMKHRIVVNVPRVSSLYGKEMRSLFGVNAKEGFLQIGADFDGLEARIEGHYCHKFDEDGQPYCKSLLGEKPNDIHTLTAKKISEVIGEPFARTPAKNVKYAASYGARPKRIAKTIGCSEAMGEKVFNAFWEAAKPLALLMEEITHFWETSGGKKFIIGIDGRKIPTRSASALINSLFQSAGNISAKRAMVIKDRMLRDEGFTIDFWTEDRLERKFSQQLIMSHDEFQDEVSKAFVKFKIFPVLDWNNQEDVKAAEDMAKTFKNAQTDKIWSDIGHSNKGYYVAYSRVGEIASLSANKAGEYYNLNVKLTAGYIIGRNWAECH
jgi:DNA polymerase I-like protein with 3'-5' exonuclease and polymerase domains